MVTTTTVTHPAAQAAAPTCNCLTKEYLPDGNILFKDLCTKEAAMTVNAPQEQAEASGPQAR